VTSDESPPCFFVTRKKEIKIVYRPTPVIDDGGNFLGIIRNMLNDGSIPAIIKVDGNNIGSCFTIQNFTDIPDISCPEIPLIADSVKNTE
jgi:hypothetical protein